jgi:hypothetical protein
MILIEAKITTHEYKYYYDREVEISDIRPLGLFHYTYNFKT